MESFAPYDLAHARRLDATDALRPDGMIFMFPNTMEQTSFTSRQFLGLQPKAARRCRIERLAEHGVEGHFRPDSLGQLPRAIADASPNRGCQTE